VDTIWPHAFIGNDMLAYCLAIDNNAINKPVSDAEQPPFGRFKQVPIRSLTRKDHTPERHSRRHRSKDCKGRIEAVCERDIVPHHVLRESAETVDRGKRFERPDGKTDDRNIGLPQFLRPKAGIPETTYVNVPAAPVQRLCRFGQLSFTTTCPEF
jgi:hypothetical protein